MRVIVPAGLVELAQREGPTRVSGLRVGQQLRDRDVAVTAVPAIHAVAMGDGYALSSDQDDVRWVGYVVTIDDGPTFWHAGDSLMASELEQAVRPHCPVSAEVVLRSALTWSGQSWVRRFGVAIRAWAGALVSLTRVCLSQLSGGFAALRLVT